MPAIAAMLEETQFHDVDPTQAQSTLIACDRHKPVDTVDDAVLMSTPYAGGGTHEVSVSTDARAPRLPAHLQYRHRLTAVAQLQSGHIVGTVYDPQTPAFPARTVTRRRTSRRTSPQHRRHGCRGQLRRDAARSRNLPSHRGSPGVPEDREGRAGIDRRSGGRAWS